ncbi:MAG: BrxA family protein [Cyanobacteria bacterium P01_A01_bin.83]
MNFQSTVGRVKTSTNAKKYSFSFANRSLLYQDSVGVATLFVEFGNWNQVRDLVVERNLLQTRTQKSSVRLCREICSRLKTLREKEINLLVDGMVKDKGYILWLALCRRYKFIRDFAVEVLIPFTKKLALF